MNLDLGMALDVSKSSAWVKADSGGGAVPPVPSDLSLHVQLLCTGGLAFLPGGQVCTEMSKSTAHHHWCVGIRGYPQLSPFPVPGRLLLSPGSAGDDFWDY